jgi:hypothetical protein
MIDHLEIMSIFCWYHNEESTYNLMDLMNQKEYLLRMIEFGLVKGMV